MYQHSYFAKSSFLLRILKDAYLNFEKVSIFSSSKCGMLFVLKPIRASRFGVVLKILEEVVSWPSLPSSSYS